MKFVSIKHCWYDNENVKILTEGCYMHWCFSAVGALFFAKLIKLSNYESIIEPAINFLSDLLWYWTEEFMDLRNDLCFLTLQECFSFSVYTSEYQFGLCREWLDQANSYQQRRGIAASNKSGVQQISQQCKSCSRHANCSSCLQNLNCGWCYSVENPILGLCVEGDFNIPRIGKWLFLP